MEIRRQHHSSTPHCISMHDQTQTLRRVRSRKVCFAALESVDRLVTLRSSRNVGCANIAVVQWLTSLGDTILIFLRSDDADRTAGCDIADGIAQT